jgi:Flp pilus assembly pilin Flp
MGRTLIAQISAGLAVAVAYATRRPPASAGAGEGGQTLVEYALVISLVSIGSIVALGTIGTSISGLIDSVAGAF